LQETKIDPSVIYDNTVAEETNPSPVELCTAPFHQRKLIDYSLLSVGLNFTYNVADRACYGSK